MKTAKALVVEAAGDREILIARDFDAPRRLVFEALTRPELVVRWLGVRAGWTLAVCEIDLRVGGRYRYVWRHAVRGDMGSGGVYREIDRPERIVATEQFDDPWYQGECIATTVLVERGGKTTMTMTLLYESRDARDGVLKSPMEQGLGEGFDKLAEVLASELSAGSPRSDT